MSQMKFTHLFCLVEPLVSPTNFEQVPNTTLSATSGEFQWDPVDPSPEKMRGQFGGYRVIVFA